MIAILDYGVGNLLSIQNMLKKAGIPVQITKDLQVVMDADKLILPGVGHFEHCMVSFNKSGLRQLVEKEVLENKKPILGVCVGHQMLFEHSEEGNVAGLGWLKGNVVKFDKSKMPPNLKIPHMAWSDTSPINHTILMKDIIEPRFYFVHSYHVVCNPILVSAMASYGYDFVAAVNFENIYGVQFHPEKSHKFGMQLYKNYAVL